MTNNCERHGNNNSTTARWATCVKCDVIINLLLKLIRIVILFCQMQQVRSYKSAIRIKFVLNVWCNALYLLHK